MVRRPKFGVRSIRTSECGHEPANQTSRNPRKSNSSFPYTQSPARPTDNRRRQRKCYALIEHSSRQSAVESATDRMDGFHWNDSHGKQYQPRVNASIGALTPPGSRRRSRPCRPCPKRPPELAAKLLAVGFDEDLGGFQCALGGVSAGRQLGGCGA